MSCSALWRADSIPLPTKNSVVFLMTSRTVSMSVVVAHCAGWRKDVPGERRQLLLVLRLLQRSDDVTELPFHHLGEIVQRQADAVIRHPVLRKVVRADPFAAIPRSNLALPRR